MKSIQELAEKSLDRDVKIHRILGVERFLQLIHEKQLTLMAPEKWQDPYEKALQSQHEQHGDAVINEKVYGLCWSSEGRSDALWQIYSPNKLGIKISSTVSNLVRALGPVQGYFQQLYLGRVAYLPESSGKKENYAWPERSLGLSANDFTNPIRVFANAIDEILNYHPVNGRGTDRRKARTFLIKRRAFQHEAEIRLLCFTDNEFRQRVQNERDQSNKVIKLPVSLEDLITQVEFDPRMGDDVVEAMQAVIRPMLRHLNKPNQIEKSTLYTIPRSKGFSQ